VSIFTVLAFDGQTKATHGNIQWW